ncbi:MAG: patatin-like phospholipase family protein [Desulfovibrionaceae bacterium]
MKNVLVLNGGGGKGIYTLGVLYEIENMFKTECGYGKLSDFFTIFFGTSTGSIIATALANNMSIEEIYMFYYTKLPSILFYPDAGKVAPQFFSKKRTKALKDALYEVFAEYPFDYISKNLTLFATDFNDKQPRIFYTDAEFAGEDKQLFIPGFGASLVEGISASCAAYPIFDKVHIEGNGYCFDAIDGGYYANNPSLFAVECMQRVYRGERCKILNIGVGKYAQTAFEKMLNKMDFYKLINIIMDTVSSSTVQITKSLCRNSYIEYLHISKVFEHKIDFFVHQKEDIELLFTEGRKSFMENKKAICTLFSL